MLTGGVSTFGLADSSGSLFHGHICVESTETVPVAKHVDYSTDNTHEWIANTTAASLRN